MLKYNIVHVMSILRRYGHTVPVSTELFIVVNIGIHSFILPHSHSVSSPLVRLRYMVHPKLTTAIHVTRRCEGKQVKATVCTGHCVWSWLGLGFEVRVRVRV